MKNRRTSAKKSLSPIRLAAMVLVILLPVVSGALEKPAGSAAGTASDPVLEEILKGIDGCYLGTAFSALFKQESTLAAMDITDTASGRIFVKHPDMMRWEYEFPEEQIILSDGKTLWIHRPLDNQVMKGKAPEYLGGGQGGSFLSDIRTLRKQFAVTLESNKPNLPALLKLLPVKATPELADIFIAVDPDTYRIVRITTHNAYGDETRIFLSSYRFDLPLDDALFRMEIPKSAEVFELEGER